MGYAPTGYHMRKLLDNDKNFEEVVDHMSNSIFISPSYITISGTMGLEGVVLTRNRWDTEYAWWLGDDSIHHFA